MRLKSLELIGFKSFVDRTIISFDEGITSIVGPNGSGKSNVCDAIRWVMGEQSAKHLRGNEMSDVIFNGSEARPATGMASVFLTFDNADGRAPVEYANYSEITLGRRLYRSGESEYYINKVPCRHKDIIEFFLGTGVGTKAYSIVEQGQIEKIVSAKPEERRQLLEEAAGISKFKMHRDSALRKIEATRQNLARLTDIITELEHQKNSLSRQAKKAERYKQFADELKTLDLSLASHQYRTWAEELETIRTKLGEFASDEASKGALVANEETQIDAARIELTDKERKLNALQEKIYELQNSMRLNEAEVKFKTDQLVSTRARCETDSRDITDLKAKLTATNGELASLNSLKVNTDIELATFEEEVEKIQQDAQGFQKGIDELNQNVEDLRREVFSCIKSISEDGARLEQIERQNIDIAGKLSRNQTEIDAIDKKIAEIEVHINASQGVLDGVKTGKENTALELNSLVSDTEKIKQELHHFEADYSILNSAYSVKHSRLASLEELRTNFEGYHDGVRAVLKRKTESSEFSGVYGTVSEMIEADPYYEPAVSAALGEKLQYVVVKSHQEGIEAIDYLKAQSAGRSTFVPMEVRESSEATSVTGEGIVGPLLNYVRFSNDYQKICRYLFNDMVLVEDLERALKIWRTDGNKNTLVTLSGEVIDRHGVVSGGAANDSNRQFLAKKREIAELSTEVARLSQEVATKNSHLTDLKNKIQVSEARIATLKSQLHSQEVDAVHKERDVISLNQDIDSWRRTRERLTVETAALVEERDSMNKEKEELTAKITELDSRHLEIESQTASKLSMVEGLRAESNKINEEVTTKRVQLASIQEQNLSLERDIKRLTETLAEIEAGIAAKMDDITNSNHEIERDQKVLEFAKGEVGRLVQDIEAVSKEQNELKLTYDKSLEELRTKELALREHRKVFEEIKSKTYELKLEETKSSEKIFYLEREIQEKYHLDLASRHINFNLEEGQNTEEVSARAQELKEKIEKMGTVSSDAISEYENVLQRYEFLTKQSEDLKVSLETLQKAIIRINRTSKERFIETFNAVNDKFKALFPRLFHGGGKAELILIDQEDVLESGIEIIAQPPGKKLQNVSLLSGGEKALVATTFIFSIFLIKPSPFCLLDEVDAPLDDANVDRFNQLIREMSRISQFIMITHNRRTMELADTLYGVTMEEAGISKIVSVKLEQADKLETTGHGANR